MKKELLFIGLGRMGAAMTKNLVEKGYVVHGFDVNEDSRAAVAETGVEVSDTITDAVQKLSGRKVVWLMVPSKFVDAVLAELLPNLVKDDIIIDGGNSFFKDTLRRAQELKEQKLHLVDAGTSGGMQGARKGASIMVGGQKEAVAEVVHIFEALATEDGYAHVGGPGAGHFVKMVHNGIEYGMMGAIAEGMAFIENHQAEFDIDMQAVLKPYEHGSIITSRLMSWMAEAYRTELYLDGIAGEVPKGETEFEMEHIVSEEKTPILAAALKQRRETRGNPSRVGTLLSAMRNLFGGHKTIRSKEGK